MLPTVTLLSQPSVSWFLSVRNVDHAQQQRIPGSLQSSSTTASTLFLSRIQVWAFLCLQLAYLLSQFQYFVCPVGFNSETNGFTVECEPSDIFVMQEYTLPAVLQRTLGLVRIPQIRSRKSSSSFNCFNVCCFPLSETGQHVPLSDPQHLPLIVRVPHRAFWWLLCQWL